jgi:hypothetical protein
MDKLRDFYRTTTATCAVLLAVAAVYLVHTVEPYVSHQFGTGRVPTTVFKLLTSSTCFALLFALAEWLVRTMVWRWRYPQWDYSGVWIGITTYEKVMVPSERVKPQGFRAFRSPHPTEIVQDDCMSIAIGRKDSPDFASWHSLACNLDADGDLEFAYAVEYKERGTGTFPDSAVGYEKMSVAQLATPKRRLPLPEFLRGKTPIRMVGTFAHCAFDNKPVYRGSTIFVRKDYVAEADLADEDRSLIADAISRQPVLRTR